MKKSQKKISKKGEKIENIEREKNRRKKGEKVNQFIHSIFDGRE